MKSSLQLSTNKYRSPANLTATYGTASKESSIPSKALSPPTCTLAKHFIYYSSANRLFAPKGRHHGRMDSSISSTLSTQIKKRANSVHHSSLPEMTPPLNISLLTTTESRPQYLHFKYPWAVSLLDLPTCTRII